MKQLIKNFYGITTFHCLKKIFKLFIKKKLHNKISFLSFLDSKLDNALVKTGLTSTIFQAKQSICHGKVFVNNKKITSSFFFLSPGDLFMLQPQLVSKQILPINILYNPFLKFYIFHRYLSSKELYYPFIIDNLNLYIYLKKYI